MQAFYPLKIQAIRSKGQQARLYVYFPLPLAAAIGLQAGEEVQWELLDRGELHLVRKQLPQLQATQRVRQGGEIPTPPPAKQTAKDKRHRGANVSSSRSAS
jgi:hypothetical protein